MWWPHCDLKQDNIMCFILLLHEYVYRYRCTCMCVVLINYNDDIIIINLQGDFDIMSHKSITLYFRQCLSVELSKCQCFILLGPIVAQSLLKCPSSTKFIIHIYTFSNIIVHYVCLHCLHSGHTTQPLLVFCSQPPSSRSL